MQPGNSIQRWVDAAGQLNSMLCGNKAVALHLLGRVNGAAYS